MSDPATFDLATFLDEERRRADHALARAMDRLDGVLPADEGAAVRHAVLTGGKRLRPILCVAAHRACGGSGGDAGHDLGAALEMIHAYSLMHDDLPCMDDADLRRGRPTPHKVFGEATAMRAGAALIPAAGLQAWRASQSMGCGDEISAQVVAELMRAAGGGGMVGGQVLDLVGEGRSLSATELAALHRKKTGALLTASLRIGGLAGRADTMSLEALTTYGRGVGLAFQIADDILDATSSAETLGKNPSDAALAKSTYVTLYGLDEAERRAQAEARAAVAALERAGLESPALEALGQYVVERTH
jgi:geranylgeranyl pyrophosphate synthase